ncbi:MAG TPA: sugar phosphate nucleotidyltransferase [Acidimicrobiia bacterium]
MKVVLFCGGEGMRIRDAHSSVPKPMVTVGNRPILWHVMKYYAHFGHKEFVICLGYGAEAIKRYFLDYEEAVSNDFVLKGGSDRVMLGTDIDDWTITFVDTGFVSEIGERLRRVKDHIGEDEFFFANYADGVTELDLDGYLQRFTESGRVGGFLAVRPPLSYHVAHLDGDVAVSLGPIAEEDMWINAGYFIFRREIFDYIEQGEDLVAGAFQRLIKLKKLYAHRFDGFWSPMDTFKEQTYLDDLYKQVNAPWVLWKNGHTG